MYSGFVALTIKRFGFNLISRRIGTGTGAGTETRAVMEMGTGTRMGTGTGTRMGTGTGTRTGSGRAEERR